jgi:hypothetical protein
MKSPRFAALNARAQVKVRRELFAAHGEYWIGAARFGSLDEVESYLASLTTPQPPAMKILPAVPSKGA